MTESTIRECEAKVVSSITIASPIRLQRLYTYPGPDTGVGKDTTVWPNRAVIPNDDRPQITVFGPIVVPFPI